MKTVHTARALAGAIVGERRRSAFRLSGFRFAAVTMFLALLLGFRIALPHAILPSVGLFVGYWTAAALIWWMSRRRGRLAELAGLAIPAVDMPAVFLLLRGNIHELLAAGLVDDASRLAFHGALYFTLAIFLTSLALSTRWIVLATGTAVAFQLLLVRGAMTDALELTLLVSTVVGLLFTGAIAAYGGRRVGELVVRVSGERLRLERLGRYFSPQVATRLQDGVDADVAGRSCDVTLLFSDLRDFTRLSEHLPGERVVALLNELHEIMVAQVFAHGGTLDKYLGDGLMAYFGAPVDQPDHAERAVRCALAMQRALPELNDSRARRGEPPLCMSVGVHSGTVIVGDVGARHRREFTAIGDAVNVAARLERLAKRRGVAVLVSEETQRRVGSVAAFDAGAMVEIRGRDHPLRVFAAAAAC